MSLIIIKAITILVKTTAKPIVSWISYYNKIVLRESQDVKHNIIKRKLIDLGQNYNFFYTKFNRMILRLKKTDPIRLLPEDKALEKGVEFLSELMAYSIILTIPIYELNKAYKDKDNAALEERYRFIKITSGVDFIEEQNANILEKLNNDIAVKLKQLKEQRKETLDNNEKFSFH